MIIRGLLLCRALSKGSKFGFRNVYLAAFEYFQPGIMRLHRPIRINSFNPAPGLLIDSPGYEVSHSGFSKGCLGLYVTVIRIGTSVCNKNHSFISRSQDVAMALRDNLAPVNIELQVRVRLDNYPFFPKSKFPQRFSVLIKLYVDIPV